MICDVHALIGAERLRRQELAEIELEKRELLELLRDLHPVRNQQSDDHLGRDHLQEDRQTSGRQATFQPLRQQRREASLNLPSVSLHSSQALNGPVCPPSPQSGEGGRKSGTQSLTLDCIKQKSREVTVI